METTVAIHKIIVNLAVGQLKIVSSALLGPAKTDTMSVFILRFCHWTVVKSKFFSVTDVLDWVHTNDIFSLRNCWNCPTVRCTWVRKTTREISLLYWIDNKHVITQWLVFMLFKINVIELWNNLFQFFLFQNLFDEIFSFIPSPWFVKLTKVLNNKSSPFDSLFCDTFGPFSFSMNSEELIFRKL